MQVNKVKFSRAGGCGLFKLLTKPNFKNKTNAIFWRCEKCVKCEIFLKLCCDCSTLWIKGHSRVRMDAEYLA